MAACRRLNFHLRTGFRLGAKKPSTPTTGVRSLRLAPDVTLPA
jgi:hypothetical protein